MPLHLLGKKSWNVYNQDNIAKVRRDEVEAKAREEEEERRMQEVDADLRLQILRGERSQQLPDLERSSRGTEEPPSSTSRRKRRRLEGEDDTDRDLRLAREDAAYTVAQRNTVGPSSKSHNVSLVDRQGHISLFPEEHRGTEKNSEAEAESAKKKREFEDQYTMRFSNASGTKQDSKNPWYSAPRKGQDEINETPSKDVWGNEDPRRKERERKRLDSNDPLAAMKKGVGQLRQAETRRKEWMEQRERDLKEVEDMARENERRKRRHEDDNDSLEDFSLDQGYREKREKRKEHHSRHRSEKHHRRHSRQHPHGKSESRDKHRESRSAI